MNRTRRGPALLLALLTSGCFFVDNGEHPLPGTTTEPTEPSEPTTGEPLPPGCGDGIVQPGEDCDLGPGNGTFAACNPGCMLNVCGDGIIGPAELCDDGNNADDDGCTHLCQPPRCGDGLPLFPDEDCDDGNTLETDDCTSRCASPTCGDGFLQPGEDCDDGIFNDDYDRCSTACVLASCGDGLRQDFECCDDGNQIPGDGCDSNCQCDTCGDGMVDDGEDCDDFDTCTSLCHYPVCGDGIMSPNEACDDGNTFPFDDCNTYCENSWCGDGFRSLDEICDDGNFDDGDGCSSECVRDGLFIFVSSASFSGSDLFDPERPDLEKADIACAQLAVDAGYNGLYRAWLSTDAASPATRFNKALDLPYILPPDLLGNSVVVADGWVDLVDGTLASPIRTTEKGEQLTLAAACGDPTQMAWTGTARSAGPLGDNCDAWSTGDVAQTGLAGLVGATDARWTDGCPDVTCNQVLRLYCVEQVVDGFF